MTTPNHPKAVKEPSQLPYQPRLIDMALAAPGQTAPELVSFRSLVPEITETTYLTHALYYYPAKFIPQVVRYCLNEYSAEGSWVIDPFAGSATV
ncbi:MAG TPA: hypothetical protein VI750_09635, partial [Pyrinomonadaceae bacterium]|nr:hypothetical protein [Pyrinomonadaceae bacterium]